MGVTGGRNIHRQISRMILEAIERNQDSAARRQLFGFGYYGVSPYQVPANPPPVIPGDETLSDEPFVVYSSNTSLTNALLHADLDYALIHPPIDHRHADPTAGGSGGSGGPLADDIVGRRVLKLETELDNTGDHLHGDDIYLTFGGDCFVSTHTHAGSGYGPQVDHDNLTNVTVNQHHNKSHAHSVADGSGQINTDQQFISSLASGNSPLSIASSTQVSSLNVDLLDGYHASNLLAAITGNAAPVDAQYVVLAVNATLTVERVLTGTANQVTITDNGAGSTVVLSVPQNIHTAATPTFASLKLTSQLGILEGGATPIKYTYLQGGDQAIDLTYTLPTGYPAVSGYALVSTDAGVMSWAAGAAGAPTDAQYVTLATNATLTAERVLTGTANQITVTDNGAGSTVVLSLPQNYDTAATPQLARLGLGAAADATSPLLIDKSGIAVTSTSGLVLQNITAATAGATVQYSPRIQLHGTAWESTALASQNADWKIEVVPVSASPIVSNLYFGYSLNDAAYTYLWRFNTGGVAIPHCNIRPNADSTYNLGTSSFYWSNTFTDRVTVNSTAYWDGASAGVLAGTGALTLTGKITNYNSVATEGYGMPAIVDDVALTAQAANIASTNFTNAGTAGTYRISYYMLTTTLDISSSSISLTIAWNDGTASRTGGSGNLELLYLLHVSGEIFVKLGSGNISYSVSIFTGNYNNARYALYMTAERLS